MQKQLYFGAAFLSYFLWGFFSLALKPIHAYASIDILFYRILISVLIITTINLVFRKKTIQNSWIQYAQESYQTKQKFTIQTALGGLILIFNWFTFIYVMNHIGVKVASFAYLVCPILTTVLAFIFIKEKLYAWQWLAVSLSICACALLSYHDFANLIYSLIVASTYSFYLINQRKNYGFDKFLVLNVQLLIAFLLLLPFYPFISVAAVPTESFFYVCIVIIVVVFTIAPLFLNLFALQGLSSGTIGILIYVNPIINFLLALFYFHEKVTSVQLISYSIILISIVVFNKKILFETKIKAS